MNSKRISFALVVLFMSATGFAADSFFQGAWVGQWGNGVDITITIGNKNKDGLFPTSYSWGSARRREGGVINSGSLETWGKEQEDQFLIEWKNKEGVKSSITLKRTEDSVKAIYDTDGKFTGATMSDRQTYVKRKSPGR